MLGGLPLGPPLRRGRAVPVLLGVIGDKRIAQAMRKCAVLVQEDATRAMCVMPLPLEGAGTSCAEEVAWAPRAWADTCIAP